MSGWMESLGVVGWPLVSCSVLGLAVLLDRLWFFVRTWRPPLSAHDLVGRYESGGADAIEDFLTGRRHPWGQGFRLLIAHELYPASLREQVVTLWVNEQRLLLGANLRWLTLVAVVSPLLGLLGTVLGMIEAFAALVDHGGPVRPAILADGLQQALFTTAIGLIIAVPALTAAHVFRHWGDSRIDRLKLLLNHLHLAFEGGGVRHRTSSGWAPHETVVAQDAPASS
jgi:biopolymer transport protein ExbB